MTTYVYGYSTTVASGYGQQLLDGDNLYLAAGQTLGSQNSTAINSDSGSNRVNIFGNAVGYSGVYLGGADPTSHDSRLHIYKDAQVWGYDYIGVALQGYGHIAENEGFVFGELYGFFILNYVAVGTNTIRNSGTVESDDYGVYHSGAYASKLVLTNSGTVDGGKYSFFSIAATGVDQVTNTGKMIGAIDLGGGADIYDGRKGHHTTGLIQGGAGNDKIYGGVEADSIKGGSGRDTLTGGDGKDIFYFGSAGESGNSASTRDIIVDFKHGTDKIGLANIDATPGGGNDAFIFDAARGTSTSAVSTGHVAWYWADAAGTANDKTIIKMNIDGDTTIESTIELTGLISLTAADFIL